LILKKRLNDWLTQLMNNEKIGFKSQTDNI
jgi:hypothetical protein